MRVTVFLLSADPPEMKSYGHAQGFSSRSMINTPSRVMAVSTRHTHDEEL